VIARSSVYHKIGSTSGKNTVEHLKYQEYSILGKKTHHNDENGVS
jgi:hypothetical protein